MKEAAKFLGKVVFKLFAIGLCTTVGAAEVMDFVRYFNGDSNDLPI